MLLKIGDKAPDFNLLNQDGEAILSKLKGTQFLIGGFILKQVIPVGTIQGQGFRDELNQFNDKTLRFFGVSADSVKRQKNFHLKQNFNFDLLSDESHYMLKKYELY